MTEKQLIALMKSVMLKNKIDKSWFEAHKPICWIGVRIK
jgi:hypothetical protein